MIDISDMSETKNVKNLVTHETYQDPKFKPL